MRKFVVATFVAAGMLAASGAFAQDTPPQGGAMPMPMPTQGGMCGGPGGMCSVPAPAQATPMQGMTQGQQGAMAMGCCPMMQRAAAVEGRLRQLEERAGIPTPPAQPAAPHASH